MTNLLSKLFSRFRRPEVLPPPTQEELVQQKREKFAEGVRKAVAIYTEELRAGGVVHPRFPLAAYLPPTGVAPAGSVLAMDAAWNNLAMDTCGSVAGVLTSMTGITSNVLDGLGFPGFAFLTELTQLTEYRDMSERTAAEMTRKWIKLRSKSKDDNKQDLLDLLERELQRHNVRDLFRQAAVIDGFMGRSQLFVNLGASEGPELETPLMLNPYKIKKNSLRGFKLVEPITTYPAAYNSSNPLAADYYVPSSWFVYGKKVHASRLLTFVSRPLPDLLKPVYNFAGMSLSQLAQPYVDYWFGTRDSVGKLLKNFSITVLNTDLDTLLSPGGDEVIRRAKLFTKMRDNQGIFLANKASESIEQLNVPLSGLDKLQAQAQEHMAAVAKTPLVILLGITPTGLNASAEGDIRIYYDYIADQQEKLFRHPLDTVFKIIMLDQLGYVDEDITYDFVSLFALTGKELALIRKSDGDLSVEMIQNGVLDPMEVRGKLATDPDSGYDNLDVDKAPRPPVTPTPPKSDAKGGSGGEQDSVTAEANSASDHAANEALALMKDVKGLALDGGFRGNQHLGGFPDSQHPSVTASRLSGAATAASRQARQLGTARSHRAALAAHDRARKAHERALSSAEPTAQLTHQAYIDAHTAAAASHAALT